MKTANSTKLALHLGGTRIWLFGSLIGWVVAGVGCHSSSGTNDEQDRLGHLKAAGDLDGGDLDAEEIDAEAIDAEAIDAEAIDAEAIDAEAIDAATVDDAEVGQGTVDGQAAVDTAGGYDGRTTGADSLGDHPVVLPIDAVIIDTQIDVGVTEAGRPVDVGPIVDVGAGVDQARNPDLRPTADTAAPSPDLAPPSPDTALPTHADAAPPMVSPYQPGGGGFCAIAPAGTASPAAFLLLALAGLALLRRRR